MTMTSKTRIGVYDQSRRLAAIEGDVATAWRTAVAEVRNRAYSDGHSVRSFWYATANRSGFVCGQFRATAIIADRTNVFQLNRPIFSCGC